MGAAIEVFEGATAIGVGRERFLPVKTTSDLLVLRSDAYELEADGRLTKVADPTPSPISTATTTNSSETLITDSRPVRLH